MKNNLEKVYKYEIKENGDILIYYTAFLSTTMKNGASKSQEEINKFIYDRLYNYSLSHGNEGAWDRELEELACECSECTNDLAENGYL